MPCCKDKFPAREVLVYIFRGWWVAEGGVVTGSSVNHAFYLHVAVLCVVVLLAAVYLQFAIAV